MAEVLRTMAELMAGREVTARLKAEAAEVRQERDRWRELAEQRLTAVIEKREREPMTWWRWRRTTGARACCSPCRWCLLVLNSSNSSLSENASRLK
jgi:cytochrome c-type biogenesis protein CcmH/NrfG